MADAESKELLVKTLNEALDYLRGDEFPNEGMVNIYKLGYTSGCHFAADVIDNILYQLRYKVVKR